MSFEMQVPNEVIVRADENSHLSVIEPLPLPPGAEATAAFVRWAEQNPFWHHHSEMARRVDYHAEGADWVYQYTGVGHQALAAAEVSVEAA